MELEHREKGLVLRSMTCMKPLCDFDAVGFTLQYELTYTNVLTMLDLGNIPLLSINRSEEDPIILAGGPGALVPEPLSVFVDVFCIGDGEPFLPLFCEVLDKTRGMKRDERLREISKIPGAYVPALQYAEYGKGIIFSPERPFLVSRNMVRDLNEAPFPKEMAPPGRTASPSDARVEKRPSLRGEPGSSQGGYDGAGPRHIQEFSGRRGSVCPTDQNL